jgi:P-type Cu2+ transporter
MTTETDDSFEFNISISCINCSRKIESALQEDKSIQFVDMDVEYCLTSHSGSKCKKTIITTNTSPKDRQKTRQKIISHLEQLGFTLESNKIFEGNPSAPEDAEDNTASEDFEANATSFITSHWFLGILGCTVGIAMLLTMLIFGGLPLYVMIPLGLISTGLTLALGARSYYDAWQKLVKARTLTMDTLFAISTLSIIVVSCAAFFVPWLPMMFEAGLLIYGFRHIGMAIENTLKRKIHSPKFVSRTPEEVTVYKDSKKTKVKTGEVNPGDIIIIQADELVPLDGVCVDETSSFYTTIKNGITDPTTFRAGESVFAGMKSAAQSEQLIKVTKTKQFSYLARQDRHIAKSRREKAPLELKTSQILSYFIPTVIILAISSGILIGLFFPPAVAIQCFVSVLVSACPCILGLIIPLILKAAMRKALKNDIRFRNAKALQEAEQCTLFILDLNGTLTTGTPTVVKHTRLNTTLSEDDFLGVCAALEAEEKHPIGRALLRYITEKTTPKFKATLSEKTHHAGIVGTINEKKYAIGSQALMQELNINIPDIKELNALDAGNSVVYVAEAGELIGYIVLQDPLRKDAIETVKTLQKMGKVHIGTGADEKTAQQYAKLLNIPEKNVHANRTGLSENKNDSKPELIAQFIKQGEIVLGVGDAGNDAQMLSACNFAVAVTSPNSDELTLAHAGVIVKDLRNILNVIDLSKRTVRSIKFNLAISLAYNLTAVALSGGLLVLLGITLNPAVGAALMILQACIVLLNVYHFKRQAMTYPLQKQNTTSTKYINNELSNGITHNLVPEINNDSDYKNSKLYSDQLGVNPDTKLNNNLNIGSVDISH